MTENISLADLHPANHLHNQILPAAVFSGYIDLEQERYNDAIATFNESLKVGHIPSGFRVANLQICTNMVNLQTLSDTKIAP